MNKKEEILAQFFATGMMLGGLADSYPTQQPREPKDRTIRKCADPKKKSKRKMTQASKKRNRR